MKLDWYPALLLASACAPTDPVLANSIVNGRFAELHINRRVRQLLSGESASNDGTLLDLLIMPRRCSSLFQTRNFPHEV